MILKMTQKTREEKDGLYKSDREQGIYNQGFDTGIRLATAEIKEKIKKWAEYSDFSKGVKIYKLLEEIEK